MKSEELKQIVREKYAEIAGQSKEQNESSCCGAGGCGSSVDYTIFSENYQNLEGYAPEADLGLGCGLPTQFAGIGQGDSVLDLGSGAGNDCFVARSLVGENGKVTGIDFTDEMLGKANENKRKLGFKNIEFIKGDIEEMPFSENQYDVVVSNCVLNLVPDKNRAFSEIHRVLRHDGHFCVSDVVIKGTLPDNLRKDAEMYAGCVSGAIDMEEYLDIIRKNGFSNIQIHKQKEIELPEEILKSYLSADELKTFRNGNFGIFSLTVSGYKL